MSDYHPATVERVIDGDTLAVEVRVWPGLLWHGSVRLRGVDTPEKGHRAQCDRERELALRAQAIAEAWVRGARYEVALSNVELDKFGGRVVADVVTGTGGDLGAALKAAGVAVPYTGRGPKGKWCDRS